MNGLLKFAFPDNSDRNKGIQFAKTRQQNLQNINSKTYLERLLNEYSLSANSPRKEQHLTDMISPEEYQKFMSDRMKNVDYKEFSYSPKFPKERRRPGMYNFDSNAIMITNDDYNFDYGGIKIPIKREDTINHELGHVRGKTVNDTGKLQSILGNIKNYIAQDNPSETPIKFLSPYAMELLTKAKNKVFESSNYKNYINKFPTEELKINAQNMNEYRSNPDEMYAHLNEVRGRLLKDLKFNYSDTFNYEVYQKAKQKNLFRNTLFEFMDYEDLVPIFNTIANNKENNSYSRGMV